MHILSYAYIWTYTVHIFHFQVISHLLQKSIYYPRLQVHRSIADVCGLNYIKDMAFLLYQWWKDYVYLGHQDLHAAEQATSSLSSPDIVSSLSGNIWENKLTLSVFHTSHIQYCSISCSFCSGSVQITMHLMPVFPCEWTNMRFHVE